MPKKTQRMVYAKAQSVLELIDPDGHIYVLQAHDAQFPIESLAKLGEESTDPAGRESRILVTFETRLAPASFFS